MMRKGLLAGFILLLTGFACFAQAPQSNFPPGTFQSRAAIDASPVIYAGPIDVAGSAIGAWGLRCMSLAYCGGNLANVCTVIATVDTCLDFSSNATTGNLAIVTIGGLACGTVTCTVKTLYDQSGASDCSGACDVTEATVASRPILVTNCIGSLPCMSCASGSGLTSSGSLASHSQPYSVSWGAKRTSGAGYSFVSTMGGNGTGFHATDTAIVYAGDEAAATAVEGSFYAIAGLFNGGSSFVSVNASAGSTHNPGGGGISGTIHTCRYAGGTNGLTGQFLEALWWSSDKSSSFNALSANQRAYWGF